MRAFCLDHLSLTELDALGLIAVAADAGFGAVSLFVEPLPICDTPDLVKNAAARLAVASALRDRGLGVGIVEPFMIDREPDVARMQRRAALAAELGGMVNILGLEPDAAKLADGVAEVVRLCRIEGAPVVIEAYPASAIRTQGAALALAESLGPDVRLTVDSLHVIRSGGSWADVAALPPERIGHIQLNDGLLAEPESRMEEAVFGRLLPGAGEFDLPALIPYLPMHATLAVEAPERRPPDTTAAQQAKRLYEAMVALLAGTPPR